jgi:hypothetical protein
MRVTGFLLLVLLLLCAVVTALSFRDEVPHSRGLSHPDHAAMMLGADGESRHRPVLGLGLAFAVLQVSLFAGLLWLSLRGGRARAGARWRVALLGAAVLYLAAFVMLFRSYDAFARGDPVELFAGFPAPTAWMLLAVWGAPLAFLGLWIARFEALVWDGERRARFQELVARQRDGR